ncbi:MAG: hypothetical protein ACI4W6_06730 [Acutalibacteraceae bacterium]
MATEYAYAYDFDYQTAPSYAPPVPKKVPTRKPEHKPDLRKLERKKADLKAQEKAANAVVIKFFACVTVCVVAMGIVCTSFASVRTAKALEKKYLDELDVYKSKQVEVEAQLGMLVTPDRIAKIAAGRLGMIKVPDENKIYDNANAENQIVISGEKEDTAENDEINDK